MFEIIKKWSGRRLNSFVLVTITLTRKGLYEYQILAYDQDRYDIEERKAETEEAALRIFEELVRFYKDGEAPGMYTNEDWEHDRTFSAKDGQEISPDIYENFFDCLPPVFMSPITEDGKTYYSCFGLGEPDDFGKSGADRYASFGKRNGHCYYLGRRNAEGDRDE